MDSRLFDEVRESPRACVSSARGTVVEGLREATLVCRQLLRSDLRGAASAANAAASVMRALASVDKNLDTMARLDDERPTSITEDRRSDADLIRDIERELADPELRAAMARRRDEEA